MRTFRIGDLVRCTTHKYSSIQYGQTAVVLEADDFLITLRNNLSPFGTSQYKAKNFVLASRSTIPSVGTQSLLEALVEAGMLDGRVYDNSQGTAMSMTMAKNWRECEPPVDDPKFGMLHVAVEVSEGFNTRQAINSIKAGTARILADASLNSLEKSVREVVFNEGKMWYIPAKNRVYERAQVVADRYVGPA